MNHEIILILHIKSYVAREDMILPYNEETLKTYGQKKRTKRNAFNSALEEIASEPAAKRRKYAASPSQNENENENENNPITTVQNENQSLFLNNVDEQSSNNLESIENVVDNVISDLIGDIVRDNNKKSEDLKSEESSGGLVISHSVGKASYYTFCKYLSQFEVIKSDQIRAIKMIYQVFI